MKPKNQKEENLPKSNKTKPEVKKKKSPAENIELKTKKDEKLSQLETEVINLKKDKEQLFFQLAEKDNEYKDFKGRMEQIWRASRRKLLAEILEFLIDLEERALASMQKDSEPKVQRYLEGIEMSRYKLWRILEKEGVKKMEIKVGIDIRNSSLHEEDEEVENEQLPERTIVEVKKSGYLLGEQVLRPAKVNVSCKKFKK